MKAGKVLLVLGVLILVLVVVAGLMSTVGGSAGIDRDSPPAPGPASSTTSTYVPPAWSTTSTVHACGWDWKGGKFTVELWHDGSRVRKWSLPLVLVPGAPTGGGGWDLQGHVDFSVESCGNSFHYQVIVFATVEFKGVLPTVTVPETSTTEFGSTTTTWVPPPTYTTSTTTTTGWYPPPPPPGKPTIVPISIMGSGMTYELYEDNGMSSGHVKLFWSASLTKILSRLPDGVYGVKVWCQVNYVSVDGAHKLTKYSDAVDLGTFKVVGGKVSYEG